MNIPFYEVAITDIDLITDGRGIKATALVKHPANKARYLAFSESQFSMKFSATEDRRLLTGVLLVPDQKIYRNDEHGEYYLTFGAETIEQLRDMYMKRLNIHNVNIEHTDQNVDGVYLVESWLSDKSRGIAPPDAFKDYPDGSWFVTYRVENDKIWQDAVYNNTFTGFSIEGLLTVRRLNFSDDNILQQPIQVIEQSISSILKQIEIVKNERV